MNTCTNRLDLKSILIFSRDAVLRVLGILSNILKRALIIIIQGILRLSRDGALISVSSQRFPSTFLCIVHFKHCDNEPPLSTVCLSVRRPVLNCSPFIYNSIRVKFNYQILYMCIMCTYLCRL